MVCMQRKNYQPLALRHLLDKEWRRRFLPDLHELVERNRPKLTEEMVERGANAVLRLATEGHHRKDQIVRNGRVMFSLKNDPESIVNNTPSVTYARFSSKIVPAHLLATAEYQAELVEKISQTPAPAPIMPKKENNRGKPKSGKPPKNAPRVSYVFEMFKDAKERNDKHCTITSEALPLAYQDIHQLPRHDGRRCDIARCKENWPDPAHHVLVQLACGHSVHQGCRQAKRRCPCAEFVEMKVQRLTEDYSFSILSSNGTDNIEEGERDHGSGGETILAEASGPHVPISTQDLEKGLAHSATKLAELATELERRAAKPQDEPPSRRPESQMNPRLSLGEVSF